MGKTEFEPPTFRLEDPLRPFGSVEQTLWYKTERLTNTLLNRFKSSFINIQFPSWSQSSDLNTHGSTEEQEDKKKTSNKRLKVKCLKKI